jgi:hypothetical protein
LALFPSLQPSVFDLFNGGAEMKMERWIRAIAGSFILVSVGLGYFVHQYWFFFTAFVGLNLLQSAFTNWCLMEDILHKLGLVKKTQ